MTYTHTFYGTGLNSYHFTVADKQISFGQRAGIYILIARPFWPTSLPKPLYVGQTANAHSRPGANASSHEKQASANAQGFNQIGFLDVPLQSERDRIESELIERLDPPLNIQKRNALAGLFGSGFGRSN